MEIFRRSKILQRYGGTMKSVYPNLTKTMNSLNINYIELGRAIGLSSIATYRRIVGAVEWKLPEVVKVCEYFDNSNATWLFLRLDTKS